MNFDYTIHSGFIIHWTGKDIDCLHDPRWHETDKSKTNEACTAAYIKRLHSILKYGLWMTEEQKNDLSFDGGKVSIPTIPQACFTELKLSESRKHAKRYGRLGIGVKRPFVFQRLGRPLIYHHKKIKYDKFLKACFGKLINDNDNKYLLNYFKQMNSSDILNYDFYGESEWRIIFFQELLAMKLIIDPRDHENIEAYEYSLSLSADEQSKLQYLIPLDGWFAMIIYPSLEVKNMAYQSGDIRNLIGGNKTRNVPVHCIKDERGNWPIELDLDACRNF